MVFDYIGQRRSDEISGNIQDHQSSILGPIAAGLGAIGLGAAIYSTNLAKGGRLISNLLHFLGHPQGIGVTLDAAANIGKSEVKTGLAGVRSLLTSTINFKTGKLVLGPIDLIDDLRSIISAISNTSEDVANRIKTKTTEYINRKFAKRTVPSYFSHQLDEITVDQVLANKDAWFNLIGKNEWNVLSQAQNLGLVQGSTVLDKNIFLAKSGVIRDLRVSSIFTRPIEVMGRDGPQYERAGIFDFFGQGRFVSSIIGENRGFAVLAEDSKFLGPRYYIDGNIYGYVRNNSGDIQEILLDSNRKLIKSGSPLEKVALARSGDIGIAPNIRKGFIGNLITQFEKNTGIGTSYADRPSLIESAIINPAKRFYGIMTGKAEIYKNPHKYQNPFTNITDAFIGSQMPEALFDKGAVVSTSQGGRLVSYKELGFLDRLKIIFNVHDDYSVINKGAYNRSISTDGRMLNRGDLYIPKKTGGLITPRNTFRDENFASTLADVNRNQINSVGQYISSPTAKFTTVAASRFSNNFASLHTISNYLVHRINSLASTSLLGIGFAPAKTFTGNIARMAAIPLIYEAGKQVLGYADFLLESTTGFSPLKSAADIYTTLRLAQQKAREYVGIQQTSSWLEKNFPGSVDSEGSFIIRSLAPIGALLGMASEGRYKGAMAVAAGLYAAIGGPSPGQSSEELRKEYLGETKVAKRKGALWGLGYLPLFGGEVDYYDSSWYHKLKTDYKDKSLYGSREEYYKYHANVYGIPLPTPHNLFGLRNLLNPYKFETEHYYDRPYEITGSPLEEFPVIGPMLAHTIGEILKPTIRRQMNLPLLEAGIVQRGLDKNTAQMLGMSRLEISEPLPSDPNNLLNIIKKQANIATEPFGVYKFVMEFFGVNLKDDFGTVASSNIATSVGRNFYSQRYGGLFGQTEFIRRFLLSDYNNPNVLSQMTNNIRNSMPSWMPGRASEFKRDQGYFIDFSSGDPYIKLENGEGRLPGKGYEALNPLHSGTPGDYDIVDRFLILSDVAPYSQAYKSYEKKVLSMNLDKYWSDKVVNAIRYKDESIGVDKRYLRYEDTLTDLNTAIKDNAVYKNARKAYDVLTHDILAELPYVGSKLFPFRNPYEQYRKLFIEGSEFASWDRPWEGIIRPMIFDMASVNPLMGAIKGAGVGALLSGPMSFFVPIKSIGQGSSLFSGSLDTILKGAAIGTTASSARILMGYNQDFIPAHIKQESDAALYMDSINYIKYRSLAETARAQGNYGLGNQLDMISRKTLIGASNPIMQRAALPRSSDKRYYDYFVSATGPQRDQIYNGVQGYMKYVLASAWDKSYPSKAEADINASEIATVIPDRSWIGWDPAINIMGNKLSLIKHGINGVSDNYHRFGFYESQENVLVNRIPNLYQDFNLEMSSEVANDMNLIEYKKQDYISQSSLNITSYNTSNRIHRQSTFRNDNKQHTKDIVKYHYGR